MAEEELKIETTASELTHYDSESGWEITIRNSECKDIDFNRIQFSVVTGAMKSIADYLKRHDGICKDKKK